jgi:hypothetical protein
LTLEALHEVGKRVRGFGALARERVARCGGTVEYDTAMTRAHQAKRDVAAHAAQADYADLHVATFRSLE